MNVRLDGVCPPIPTPFDSNGEVAFRQLTENLEKWNAYDLMGYVVLGSNGEVVYLTQEEKLRVQYHRADPKSGRCRCGRVAAGHPSLLWGKDDV
jgi:dihydrodipicolinate synthase/N-acetylneuraminate lyase